MSRWFRAYLNIKRKGTCVCDKLILASWIETECFLGILVTGWFRAESVRRFVCWLLVRHRRMSAHGERGTPGCADIDPADKALRALVVYSASPSALNHRGSRIVLCHYCSFDSMITRLSDPGWLKDKLCFCVAHQWVCWVRANRYRRRKKEIFKRNVLSCVVTTCMHNRSLAIHVFRWRIFMHRTRTPRTGHIFNLFPLFFFVFTFRRLCASFVFHWMRVCTHKCPSD